MIRTSVELHSDFCRLVAVDVAASADAVPSGDVRVHAFVTRLSQHPESGGFIDALRRARDEHDLPREAVVTMWGLRAIHQYVRLEAVDDHALETRAIAAVTEEIALLEADGSRATIDLAAGDATLDEAGPRRDVSLTAASAIEIAYRIEPLTSAGFSVVRVITPAMALASIACSRPDSVPGVASMYVAVAPHAAAIAIVRDRMLLVARELPFGHASDEAADEPPFDVRLVSDLRRSQQFFRQTFRATLDTMVMCGDVERLRSLAASIGTALNVPVQTLDALAGIDAAAVPEPASEFRDAVSALRLAIAAGAEPAPFTNLLQTEPATPRRAAHVVPVAATAAAVLVLAIALWFAFLRPMSPRVPVRDSVSRQEPRQSASDTGDGSHGPTAGPPAAALPVEAPPIQPPVSASRLSTPLPRRNIVVNSILYSPSRRLAIINGRIARAGDDVGDVRVVAIERRAVVVDSADGVQHRIELGPATRRAPR